MSAPRAAVEPVVAAVAVEAIAPAAPVEAVAAGAAIQQVGPRSTVETVVARLAVEAVPPGTPVQAVGARGPNQSVGARRAVDPSGLGDGRGECQREQGGRNHDSCGRGEVADIGEVPSHRAAASVPKGGAFAWQFCAAPG